MNDKIYQPFIFLFVFTWLAAFVVVGLQFH